MRQHLYHTLLAVCALQAFVTTASQVEAGDSWMFRPSYFTHSPVSGERVNQYRQEDPAIAVVDPTYQESGFNYQQYDLNIGGSQSHLHVVQTWGQGALIRPYGEWEYPYRPGATPYGPWLNQRGPWTQTYDPWSNPYGSGRSGWGGGGTSPYGYGMSQNGVLPNGPAPFSGGQFSGPQAGVGQAGVGQFTPQVPQPVNPSGQGSATPRVQGPVAF